MRGQLAREQEQRRIECEGFAVMQLLGKRAEAPERQQHARVQQQEPSPALPQEPQAEARILAERGSGFGRLMR